MPSQTENFCDEWLKHSQNCFDWSKVCDDEPTDEIAEADALVKSVFFGCLSFLFGFVFSQTRTLNCAFRRFVALTYIVRPDLIDDKSQKMLAHELGVARSEIARHIRLVRDGLQLEGGGRLMTASQRANVRFGQMAARAARKNKSRHHDAPQG